MAIQLMQENGKYNIKNQHFLIDEENDLVNLENQYNCSMGDKAELPDGTEYVRHSDNYKIPIVPHQFAPHNSDVSEEMELPSYLPINVDLTQFVPGAEIIVNWNGETYSVTITEEDYSHFIGYRDHENPTFEIGYFTNGLANGQLIFAYGYNPPAPETVELTVTPLENNNLWEVESSSGGSNLPAVTLADKGKHLVVNDEIYPTSTVIVPEQTALFDENGGVYSLSNCVPLLFNDEGYVYAVINGTVASGTPVEEDIDEYYINSSDGSISVYRLGNQMGVWMDNEEPPASITVSVYVGEKRTEWGKEAVPMPVAVFDFRPGKGYIVSGSYSVARAAFEQFDESGKEMPFMLACVLAGSGNRYSITEFVGWQLETGYIRLILSGSIYWHWNEDGSLEYED